MTFDERLRALESLRLTPRQTRFVATVALHSGYCLRRQYMAFAGLQYGKVVREFLDGLVARRLAVRIAYRTDRGFLYHMHARSIYRALQQDDNRNRRTTSPALIGRKLMMLDFVIGEPDAEWYATETDKVELFTTRFGISVSDLPQVTYAPYDQRMAPTTRYFTHKLPIFLKGEPPTVHFAALALEPATVSFERFLADHARLLHRLSAWAIVLVGPRGGESVAACRAVFARYLNDVSSSPVLDLHAAARYFALRRSVERNDLAALSVADLNYAREARQRFTGPASEAIYARWLVNGDAALELEKNPSQRTSGSLVHHELPFRYEQFGDLPGVC